MDHRPSVVLTFNFLLIKLRVTNAVLKFVQRWEPLFTPPGLACSSLGSEGRLHQCSRRQEPYCGPGRR